MTDGEQPERTEKKQSRQKQRKAAQLAQTGKRFDASHVPRQQARHGQTIGDILKIEVFARLYDVGESGLRDHAQTDQQTDEGERNGRKQRDAQGAAKRQKSGRGIADVLGGRVDPDVIGEMCVTGESVIGRCYRASEGVGNCHQRMPRSSA